LTAEHLPLLKSIRDNSLNSIEEKLNVSRTLIKVLFHYHPTFYHLHIHFAHVEMTLKMGGYCCRGVLLEDVITNIEMDSNYYQKVTMMCQVGENH